MPEHALNGNHVGVHLAPRQRFDGGVDDVGSILADFEHRCHRKTGAGVAVIFDDDVRMLLLDALSELAQEGGLADAGHVLQTDFLGAGSNLLISQLAVIIESVNGRCSDAECALGGHAGLFGPLDGRSNIADVVESVEDTGDIGALGLLHAVHHLPHVVGHGIHPKGIETTVKHVRLDAHLIEWLAEGADCLIGVLTCQEVHLLEGSAVGFHTCKATHVNDDGGYAGELVLAWLKLA